MQTPTAMDGVAMESASASWLSASGTDVPCLRDIYIDTYISVGISCIPTDNSVAQSQPIGLFAAQKVTITQAGPQSRRARAHANKDE